jgi:hypothetical protein
MRIAFYGSHHSLPFGDRPEQPLGMYDPEEHLRSRIMVPDHVRGKGMMRQVVFSESVLWPVLHGLALAVVPRLAHVSLVFIDGEVRVPRRVWVQLSSLPVDEDANGLPLVIDARGKPTVDRFWRCDNGTRTPIGLLRHERTEQELLDPKIWRDFFHRCSGSSSHAPRRRA